MKKQLPATSLCKMDIESLRRLQNLFHKYYLWKRDDAACHSMFAIITAKKCIETDCAFEEAGLGEDDEILRNK
jgi:hypothetical protein